MFERVEVDGFSIEIALLAKCGERGRLVRESDFI
jgi:hypothetical protein